MTRNNNTGASTSLGNWNEYNLNPLTRINWRASLVPAAAVIPAPIAYIKVVAVKKLVVGFWVGGAVRPSWVCTGPPDLSAGDVLLAFAGRDAELGDVTLKKLECLKQAYALNTLAWNNGIGLWSCCVGLAGPE